MLRSCFTLLVLSFTSAVAADRPNILWLTFEDTSAYEIGCYGNTDVKTPNIDRLAKEGVRFTKAWSNGVQCSPSRSTLITGSYSPTFGTDIHRQARPVPAALFGFPRYLKLAGYYTSNNAKMDYNASNFDTAAVWNASSRKATYNDPARGKDQPFFSVFNANITHMSRLTSFTTEGRRDFAKEGLDPAKLHLPPHVPDLPDVRSDYAFHLEGVEDVDRWVGLFLDDLKKQGLLENTIIFVFSDHGGCLPRGKGFAYQSGLQVPLVAWFPEKWRHLAEGFSPGTPSDRLVGFVDLGPTVLSLAGVKPPETMRGQPLFGEFAAGVKPRDVNFGFTANREDNYSPARSITDGEFLYVRNYIPRRPLALRNFFQWGMPANLAWDTAFLEDKLPKPEYRAAFEFLPAEQLFDLRKDPFNIHDLAADPALADRKKALAGRLDETLRDTGDLGFFPRDARDRGAEDLYSWVQRTKYPVDRLQAAAARAAFARPEDLSLFVADLSAPEREIRYWGASGIAELAARGKLKEAPEALLAAANAPEDDIASVANEALVYLGRGGEAIPRLLQHLDDKSDEAHVVLESLSLDPHYRETLQGFRADLTKIAGKENKRKKAAMSVLANIGEYPPLEICSAGLQRGLKVNANRRPLAPDPQSGQAADESD
jgi:N-sulfoglucosamine sulfohydrolase